MKRHRLLSAMILVACAMPLAACDTSGATARSAPAAVPSTTPVAALERVATALATAPAQPMDAATTAAAVSFAEPLPTTDALAPSRAFVGLEVGAASPADVDAWLAANGLTCRSGPDPRRNTYRHDCADSLPISMGNLEDPRGTLSRVLVVRGDDSPVTHVASTRAYHLPDDVAADYGRLVHTLTTMLGAPQTSRPIDDPTVLADGFARFSTRWEWQDLRVEVVALKGVGSTITLRELWEVPGATNLQSARPGSHGMHGAVSSSRRNPHLRPLSSTP